MVTSSKQSLREPSISTCMSPLRMISPSNAEEKECKTLYLTNLESGDVVGDKVEILAEYCSSGKSKRTVLEGIVGQALKLPEVVSAGWEVL